MDKPMILKWWPVLVLLGTFLIGWGTNKADIEQLKKGADEARATTVHQAAIDERTKNIAEDLKKQETLLIQILQKIGDR